ncbi:MAG: response regulator transcription factor [Breznakibacter sp.]|nr:response regulator transcription factor [Breznakibacter sp.]
MNIKCIIIDDEFPARILLQEFIDKVPNLELTGSFKSALDALPVIQAGNTDLIFLDIQMPDITGIDFFKTLTVKPLVIFTTAYTEFAIESYQLDALDYLLKPFSFDRFMQAVNKASARLLANDLPAPESSPTKEAEKDYILIKADHKIHRIKFKQIIYIEGLREYVTFFCENNEKIVTLESLRNLEQTLPEQMFMRIHKSYIIQIDKIKALYGNQIKLDGVQSYIPIGKSYKEPVQKRLFLP